MECGCGWSSWSGLGADYRTNSLRYKYALRMPAANVLGYALVSRRIRASDESQELLKGLAADMLATHQW